jgi:hypothetical protein
MEVGLDSTLRTMKAFTSEAALNAPVEDRIVEVSIGNLQRPVRYFWSIQDFVMGLLGAVQGKLLTRFDLVSNAHHSMLRSPIPR